MGTPDITTSCSTSSDVPASKKSNNNNPKGKNQHKECPTTDDPRIPQILKLCHRRGINDTKRLSKLLLDEHGIKMSDSTIARRRRELGLKASRVTTKEVPDAIKRQLVLDQMAKDPAGRVGPRTVKLGIFRDTGVHLTRDWIANEMRIIAPDAYASRGPAHNKGRRPPSTQDQSSEPPESGSTAVSGTTSPFPPSNHIPPVVPSSQSFPSQVPTVPPPIPPITTQFHSSLASALNLPMNHNSMQVDPYVDPGNSDDDDDEPAYTPYGSNLNSSDALRNTDNQGFCNLTNNLTSLNCIPRPPAIANALNSIESTTPAIMALTRTLSSTNSGPSGLGSRDTENVMRCREAIALLDRQLARLITRTSQN